MAGGKAICTERCAEMGDKPCFKLLSGDDGWLHTCEADPGCLNLAAAALIAAHQASALPERVGE